ncbi:hypothetical protein D3C80_600550 [compost metagenome]
MHDLRRLVGGKQRCHRICIGTSLSLGELYLHARMLLLELGDGRMPPITGSGVVGLPGNEFQYRVGHGRCKAAHRHQSCSRGAERQSFHSLVHGFLLQRTSSDTFKQTERRLRRLHPESRPGWQMIETFAAIHVTGEKTTVWLEDRMLEFVPLECRQCR